MAPKTKTPTRKSQPRKSVTERLKEELLKLEPQDFPAVQAFIAARKAKSLPALELAEQGQLLASLLWRKILANVSPDVQAILYVHNDLACIWAQIAPDDFYRVPGTEPTKENLLEKMRKAEEILIGEPRQEERHE